MKIINFIFIVFIILLGITFACLNAESVTINYYFHQSRLPLSLLLVFVFGIGLLLGFIVCWIKLLRLKAENRRLRRRINPVKIIDLDH